MTATTTTESRPETRYQVLTWAPIAVLAWALGYGAVRVYWAAGHAPAFAPLPDDLVILPGWGAVGLCLAVGVIGLGLWSTRRSRLLPVAAWVTVGLIAVASAMFLLDVVGGILAGLGIPLNLVSAASRAGMLLGAVLLVVVTVAYQRRARGACSRCGRAGSSVSERPGVPGWAVWAAYIAAAGCVTRIVAQLIWGFGEVVYEGGVALIVFEVGFVLAGVLLPMALVHRFGLIWPRWVLPLAGRRVPRWLVLGPAFFVGVGLTVYFGVAQGQLVVELFTGPAPVEDGLAYGPVFLWIAVSSYLVWGLGVGLAAIARFRQTRPCCGRCGI